MALRFLLRPAVFASLAVHGGLAAVAWTGSTRARPDREACVCGMITDEWQGPVDAPDAPADPELPREVPETVAVVPPTEEPPPSEPPELVAPPQPAQPAIAFLERAPVGVRTSSRSVAESEVPSPAARAPGPPLPPAPAAPSSASRRGVSATTTAVGLPTNLPPAYPIEALTHGWEGTTVVEVEVLIDGRVGPATLYASSGYEVLDQAALEAIRQWRYQPRIVDGEPAPERLRVPVRFRLRAA